MKKTGLLAIIAFITVAANAQGPVITSWLQNTTNIVGRHYVNGNSTPITDTAHANVKSVQYNGTYVYIRTQGIPAYITGPYLDGNPSIATAQNAIFRFPLTPVENTGTATSTTGGNIGIFINGVAMFDYRDGASWQNSSSSMKGGPYGGMGDGVWNRDAVVGERGGFDCSKAHPAMGNYHHHQNPSAFNLDLNVISNVCNLYASDGLYVIDSTVHSPLLGYAYDGFPVYGPYAYKNVDGTGGIVRMKSSYIKRNITTRTTYASGTSVTAGPNVSAGYPIGYFREDYEYIPTSAATPDSLDIHNGRFCVTPEYPNGTYCYFATVDANWNSAYPYMIGPTFYGVWANAKVTTIPAGTTYYVPGSITTTYTPTTLCAGAAINVDFNSSGTFNAGNVYTAQLSDASGSFTTPVSTGTLTSTSTGSHSVNATIPANTATGAGYKLRVVSGNPVLTGSSTAAFTINALPVANITAGGPTTFCEGGSVDLTSSSGTSYSWSPGNAATQSVNVNTSGSYSVVVTSAGCSATSTSTIVTVNPLPSAPVITQTGNTLQSSAASSYQWYLNSGVINGATSQGYTATQAGNYTVEITDNNGCSASSSSTNVVVSGIENVEAGQPYVIFPNPASDLIAVQLKKVVKENCEVELFDITGKLVQRTSVYQGSTIAYFDTRTLYSGDYLIRINMADRSYSRKILIEK